MALNTVRVPADMEGLFRKAEETVGSFFNERKDDPTRGTIDIFGSRYVLLRGASLSVEFFTLVRRMFGEEAEDDADAFSATLLYDLAHSIGKNDAHNFHEKMGLNDPISRLSAGPVHFAYTGWASVDIFPESTPTPDEEYFLVYDHPYSFESHAWLADGKATEHPICVMNAGYSSGWCEESFGVTLEATEITCRAHGGSQCRFIMAPPQRLEERVATYLQRHPEVLVSEERFRRPDFLGRLRSAEKADATDGLRTASERLLLAYARELEATQTVLHDKVSQLESDIQ